MSRWPKTLIAVVLTVSLGLANIAASSLQIQDLGYGAGRWQTVYNTHKAAIVAATNTLTNQVSALAAQVLGFVTTEDQLVFITATPAHVDGDTFTVPGNFTAKLAAGKVVLVDLAADGIVFNTVASSSFGGGVTTCNLNTANLTANLARVAVFATRDGLWPWGDGRIFGRDFGSPGQAAYDAAVAFIGSNQRKLTLYPADWELAGTVPGNISLEVPRGANITGTGTLDFAAGSGLEAGPYRIFAFTGAGKATGLRKARPEWWGGAVDDAGTDNAPHIIAALAAIYDATKLSGKLIFQNGLYYVASEIAPGGNVMYSRWRSEGHTTLVWNGATDDTKAILRATVDATHYFYQNTVEGIDFNGDRKAGFGIVIEGGAVFGGSGSSNLFRHCFFSNATVCNVLIGDNAEPMVNDVDASRNRFEHCSFYDALYNVKINAINAYLTQFPGCIFGQTTGAGYTKQHLRIKYGGATWLEQVEFTQLDRYTAGHPHGADDDCYAVWAESAGLYIGRVYMEESRLLYIADQGHSPNGHYTVENVYINDSRASANLDKAFFINNTNAYLSVKNSACISSAASPTARILNTDGNGTLNLENVDMGAAGYVRPQAIKLTDTYKGHKSVVDGYRSGSFKSLVDNWNMNKWKTTDTVAPTDDELYVWGKEVGAGATARLTRSTLAATGKYSAKISITVAAASGLTGISATIPRLETDAVTVIACGFLSSSALNPGISINGGVGQIGSTAVIKPGSGYYDFVAWAEASLSAQADGTTSVVIGLPSGVTGDLYVDSVVVIPALFKNGTQPMLAQAAPDKRAPTVLIGNAAPTGATNGPWERGDIVQMSAAASGSPMGWACTAAGTPGTWTAMPNLP